MSESYIDKLKSKVSTMVEEDGLTNMHVTWIDDKGDLIDSEERAKELLRLIESGRPPNSTILIFND